MVKTAPVFAEIAPRWLDFVSESVLIAHNAPFDTSFLNHEISRVYPGHRMVNPHLCTVRLSRRALPELTNHRLDTIASHFSIPIVSRHRAGSDALATAELFLLLLSKLEAEHGITDLAAARNFQFSEPKQDEKTPLAFPHEPLIPGL
jgi:DNA polymerase III epsilon subunit-like protein